MVVTVIWAFVVADESVKIAAIMHNNFVIQRNMILFPPSSRRLLYQTACPHTHRHPSALAVIPTGVILSRRSICCTSFPLGAMILRWLLCTQGTSTWPVEAHANCRPA